MGLTRHRHTISLHALGPLRHGPALLAPSSPQPLLTPPTHTCREARHVTPHVPLAPFEPRAHLLSLPCLISLTPSASHAQPLSLEFAGDPRPPCRLPRAPDAAPSLPEHCPEVRNLSLCFVCPDSASP
jgi:hypothetical protein